MNPPVRAAAERRSLLILAAVTLVPFVILAVWARVASPAPWEPGILSAVALQEGLFGDLFRAINSIGNLPIWAGLVAALAVGSGFARGVRAGVMVGVSLVSDLAAFGIKIVVERQRPETAATEHFFGPDSFAFPSGHVVRAVALVAALVWVLAPPKDRLRLALAGGLLAGAVMGFARVALGVHWPTDALGGALLGLSWFAVTAWLSSRQSGSVGRA